MYKVYLVSGYNSWNNEFICRAIKHKLEADNLKAGLTEGDIRLIAEDNAAKAINKCIAINNELRGAK